MTIIMALMGLEYRRPSAEEWDEHRRRMDEIDARSAKIRRKIVGAYDPFTGLEWDPELSQDCSL